MLNSHFRNVSYNNLSGIVPPMRNFSRFSSDRYGDKLLHTLCICSYNDLHLYQLHWKSFIMWQLVGINLCFLQSYCCCLQFIYALVMTHLHLYQLHWKSFVMWQLVGINMWASHPKIQRYCYFLTWFCGGPLIFQYQ